MATALFFSPHQDDETLTMGAAISNHLNAGHSVHVILCSDGISSAARSKTPLSRTQFSKARDDEFKRACLALGVPASNIHISRFAVEDGKMTVSRARDIIMEYVEKFPGAMIKTHTDRGANSGQHSDHYNLGIAAMRLFTEGVITDLRFYVEQYQLEGFYTQNPDVHVSLERTATPTKVQAALNEYKRVNHSAGQYGIGYLSVPTSIDKVMANPVSYFHKP